MIRIAPACEHWTIDQELMLVAMGTRINAMFEHNLVDFRDPAEVLARLGPTANAAFAVRDYWLELDPSRQRGEVAAWQAEPVSQRSPGQRSFVGPGSLFLTVTAAAARIRTGGRFRGFLAVEALRLVHLRAFREVAVAFGARQIAVHADHDDVDDLLWSGQPFQKCAELMGTNWGPPQVGIDWVDPSVAARAEFCVPSVWFLESCDGGGTQKTTQALR